MARRERIPPKEENNFAGSDEVESLDGVTRCLESLPVSWVFLEVRGDGYSPGHLYHRSSENLAPKPSVGVPVLGMTMSGR